MFAPVVARRARRGAAGARLRVDGLRRPVGGRGAADPGRRRRPAAGRDGLHRDLARRHHRRRHARPGRRAARPAAPRRRPGRGRRGALPRHLRPGPRQHDRRAAARRHHRRRERRRSRRLPVRRQRHRQPRHRGPRLAAARPRHRDRRRPARARPHVPLDGRAARPPQPVPRRSPRSPRPSRPTTRSPDARHPSDRGAGLAPQDRAGVRPRGGRTRLVRARPHQDLPVRGRARHGRDGPVRPAVPGGVRRHGRRLLRPVPGARGARQGRPERRHHPRGRRLARRDAGLPLRHRGAEAGLAAAAVQRVGARGVRADRAGRGQRRRRDAYDRRARGRRLADQREQGVHHQLRHRHHQAGHGHRRDRSDVERQEGDQLDPRARADARVHRRAAVRQGRLERLRHPPADVRGRARAGGEPARRSAAAATPTSCTSWTRAASRSPRCRPASRRAASTRA